MNRKSAGDEYATGFTIWSLAIGLIAATLTLIGLLIYLLSSSSVPEQLTTAAFLLIVATGGALGGLIHALNSFATYVGVGKLKNRWVPWYLILPFQATALAMAITMVIKAGLFSPAGQDHAAVEARNTLAQAYVFAAVSVLVGMFVEVTVKKLKDVAYALLGKPEERPDHFEDDEQLSPENGHALLNAQLVIKECEKAWPTNKSDASGFVKAVASACRINEIPTAANADAIVSFLQTAPGWTELAAGADIAAKSAADQGRFVIGGLPAAELNLPNGQVVIVVSGPLDATRNRYPTAYWGLLGSEGKKATTLNYAFPTPKVDQVRYFVRELPNPEQGD